MHTRKFLRVVGLACAVASSAGIINYYLAFTQWAGQYAAPVNRGDNNFFLAMLALGVSILAFLDVRTWEGSSLKCKRCSYSLKGHLTEIACPECGEKNTVLNP